MPTFRSGFPLPFEEFRDELDRFWTTLAAPVAVERRAADVFPAVNVGERDDALVVEAELPGLDASALEITVHGDHLTIAGTRADHADQPIPAAEGDAVDASKKPVTWHRRERRLGSFTRRLALPVKVDPARIEAQLVNGVLTITCPTLKASQPRKVEVRTG